MHGPGGRDAGLQGDIMSCLVPPVLQALLQNWQLPGDPMPTSKLTVVQLTIAGGKQQWSLVRAHAAALGLRGCAALLMTSACKAPSCCHPAEPCICRRLWPQLRSGNASFLVLLSLGRLARRTLSLLTRASALLCTPPRAVRW